MRIAPHLDTPNRPNPAQPRPARWLIIALASIVLLAGCSSHRMAYSFLDWYAMWRVDKLVSLDRSQRTETRDAVREFHQWHQDTQLILYAGYLEQLQKRLSQDSISPEEIHAQTDKIQVLLDHSLQRMLPIAVQTLSQLSDQQVDELLENLTELREEYIEENIEISDEERLKKRYEDLEERLKPWVGSLNKQQKQWVLDWSQAFEGQEELTAQQYLTWQNQLEGLLENRAEQEALLKGLQELMFYRKDGWDPDFRAALDRNQERTLELMAQLANNLTTAQTRRLDRRIDRHIRDFLKLSGQTSVPEAVFEALKLPEKEDSESTI